MGVSVPVSRPPLTTRGNNIEERAREQREKNEGRDQTEKKPSLLGRIYDRIKKGARKINDPFDTLETQTQDLEVGFGKKTEEVDLSDSSDVYNPHHQSYGSDIIDVSGLEEEVGLEEDIYALFSEPKIQREIKEVSRGRRVLKGFAKYGCGVLIGAVSLWQGIVGYHALKERSVDKGFDLAQVFQVAPGPGLEQRIKEKIAEGMNEYEIPADIVRKMTLRPSKYNSDVNFLMGLKTPNKNIRTNLILHFVLPNNNTIRIFYFGDNLYANLRHEADHIYYNSLNSNERNQIDSAIEDIAKKGEKAEIKSNHLSRTIDLLHNNLRDTSLSEYDRNTALGEVHKEYLDLLAQIPTRQEDILQWSAKKRPDEVYAYLGEDVFCDFGIALKENKRSNLGYLIKGDEQRAHYFRELEENNFPLKRFYSRGGRKVTSDDINLVFPTEQNFFSRVIDWEKITLDYLLSIPRSAFN